mmetsp:Transcript_11670/g.33573  ORF Transcript_11670/g.33573 Transcript_11670/m.33573 type:complete len:549 (-) Transcript_11670:569-2215(-)|eukprot:CAMPEP_0172373394 /NCGR_PEP_ID=MMETSP1060-20121228/51432_1 /TAXON_ID=37318 /ORGANISM="Pseudo-nitzschia pungens, Strain cf. cingulata" /LENGTH=548 /DNA_ID=CAMNT_0013099719 /DNA_START=102 /DNA_END=1751 /DNA_ORIENTATION=+
MLPTIVSRSKLILGCARRQQYVAVISGVERPEALTPLRSASRSVVSTARHLSTKTGDGSGANGREDARINAGVSTNGSREDSSHSATIKPQPTVAPPPLSGSSTTSSAHAPLSSTTTVGASNTSAIPHSEYNAVDDPKISTPSSSVGKSATAVTSSSGSKSLGTAGDSPTASPLMETSKASTAASNESVALDVGGLFSAYYDKAHRLWSDRSGMSEIFELKQSVDEAGAAYDLASAEVTTNRRNLDDTLRKWEIASGQHLQLLQRRESWTPEDAQRFADFVSLEITSRADLEQARHVLSRSEEALTKAQLNYINKMRRRYHEEQIWQDQWRVLGTYGTWSLIVLNSCVFLGSQYFQRRRELDRMDTIARLIGESKVTVVQSEPAAESFFVAEETTETPVSVVEVGESTNQYITSTKEDENSHDEFNATKQQASMDSSTEISTSGGDTIENIGQESYDTSRGTKTVGSAGESVVSTVREWEHRVRSHAIELVMSSHEKLRKALPPNLAEQMPKSASDIDVPSAIIGASVGGITVLTVSLILSSFSGRRQ